MRVLSFVVFLILAFALVVFILGQLGLLRGRAPNGLGVTDGRLKPPSKTPNSVSSQADLYPGHPQQAFARIAPLQIHGDPDKAFTHLAEILRGTNRIKVISQDTNYIYAQSTTRTLKFTDDIEFWLDRTQGVIQVRSASRLGLRDFNVNRDRIEMLRAQFNKN